MALQDEIDANYLKFFDGWTAGATANFAASKGRKALLESYRRLAAFRALRVHLVEKRLSKGAQSFFLEANNDLVTAHVTAHLCAWRASLKFLRSAIENVLYCFYYEVHPIEHRLWETGKFKVGFAAAHKFFASHPDLVALPQLVTGLEQLDNEYATLSKAVHASSRSFRMTEGELNILLWKDDVAKLGSWSTREKATVQALSLLTICLLSDELKGAKNAPTRDVLQFALGKNVRHELKAKLSITI
jgi:hypothetical protein